MSQPDWKEALPKPPDGGQLLEVWLTTYDQPDASLLVEHLLPNLLGLDNSLTQEVHERNLYFGELDRKLRELRCHGGITIISSPPRNRMCKNDAEEQTIRENLDRQSAPYPWLWRYINHFTVGEKSHAVQHAKLWAFHWKIEDSEFLELYISSTNLTTSAFKRQIQAGWSLCIALAESNPTNTKQKSWGDLRSFLDALGNSAGALAKERTDRLVQLLGRANCPSDITFVASIPGNKTLGTRLLKELNPSAIHILTPTIGDWNQGSLAAWSKDAGVEPKNIHLKWIDEKHPWAEGWALTKHSDEVLRQSIKLNRLDTQAQVHHEHVQGDLRWSHAKLYLLRIPRKKNRYLLVTSANWSVSAWGAGRDVPSNFELGVLFETEWKWLEELNDDLHTSFCVKRPSSETSKLQWVEASWNGKAIELNARSTDQSAPISAEVSISDSSKQTVQLNEGKGSVEWCDAQKPPLVARFTQGMEVLEVGVLDLRTIAEFVKTPLPEVVDPAQALALREAFLLQRYGGPAVEDNPDSKEKGKLGQKGRVGAAPVADYSVQAWTDARAAFHVVDQWSNALLKANINTLELEQVRLDGKHLKEIYAKRSGAAYQLAAEELAWRQEEKK